MPLVLSCLVYAVPLVGPHAAWLLGEVLFREVTRPGEREFAWRAADITLALGTQLVVALTIAWSVRGSRRRHLVWLPAVPLLVATLNTAYLAAIPSAFLIEADREPEVRGWPEVCLAPHVSLAPVRLPVTQPQAAASVAWVQTSDGGYATLRASDCTVVDAHVPKPTVRPGGRVDFMLGLSFALPDGRALFDRLDVDSGERSGWLWTGPDAPLERLNLPVDIEGAPVLSNDGDAIGWIERLTHGPTPRARRLLVQPRPPAATGPVAIDLAPLMPASLTVLDIDMASRTALLWRNDKPVIIDFEGVPRRLPFEPGPVRPLTSTYLRVGSGWVAWDAYRDSGAYQLAWSLPGGSGLHRLNKGRSVTSAAVDPAGAFVALSETTTLSIGDARDLVSIVRVRDQATVFRAYLARYSRSTVAFLAGDRFAYADDAGTHLLGVSR